MVGDDELIEEFSMFDVNLSTKCKEKVLELCEIYGKDAGSMVSEWIAFSHSNKMENTAMTIENLAVFENQKLLKNSKKAKTPKTPGNKQTKPQYGSANRRQISEAGDDLLDAYASPAVKSSTKKRQLTPDQNQASKRLTAQNRSAVHHSPSFSPASATPSAKYSLRTNAGEVAITHGNVGPVDWIKRLPQKCSITPYQPDHHLENKFKYMFQKLVDKAYVLNDHIDEMAELIKKQYNIEEFASLTQATQETVTVVGRVCCDSDGRLNAKSVLLEGSRETSGGKTIPIDMTNVTSYSLFPGQIVAMEGINNGKTFMASKVMDLIPSPVTARESSDATGPVYVMVASGPFTTNDSFSFEPLMDLVRLIIKEKPDVCILTGPFLDVSHEELQKLDIEYTEFFHEKLIKELLASTQGSNTKFILIPSQRDVHHENIYPQPPFVAKEQLGDRITFMPDPCLFTVSGTVFAVTSTDIVKHLSGEEISSSPTVSDRMTRLLQHLLSQQSFYPLCPPVRGLNVEYEQWSHSNIPLTPNIMVTPSELRYFVKDVNSCLAINPWSLAKGHLGGTFAKIMINKEMTKNSSNMAYKPIAAQIVRI